MSRVFERCLLFSFQKVAIVTVMDFGISKVLAELNGRSCGLLHTYYLVEGNFHFGAHKTCFFQQVTLCQIAFWPPKCLFGEGVFRLSQQLAPVHCWIGVFIPNPNRYMYPT